MKIIIEVEDQMELEMVLQSLAKMFDPKEIKIIFEKK